MSADLAPHELGAGLLRPDGPADPLVKWPGGKRRELAGLTPSWPDRPGRYLEPFVGGGAALFCTDPQVPAAINDASADLVALYRAVREQDRETFAHLDDLTHWWSGIGTATSRLVAELAELHGTSPRSSAVQGVLERNRSELLATGVPGDLAADFLGHARTGVPRKLARMARVERDREVALPADDVLANVEGAIRAAAYTAIRACHNDLRRIGGPSPQRTATFAVLRELAYASMFRFNAQGDFNVPYGGMSYNGRDLAARVDGWRRGGPGHARLASTEVHHGDFAAFFEAVQPGRADFTFLDPPYLSDFRDYDGTGFGPEDHRRLAACLRELPGPFQLVIKATPEVRRWYGHGDWTVREVDKTYAWTIKGRNDRRATHLVIEGCG